MTLTLIFVAALGMAVAYANGANDVSKGIATLVGSGVTNYRRALAWGTLWTGVGGITGAFLAHALVQTFGKGLLASGVQASITGAFATIAGAALWVGLATRKGLPVSTTHAIVGSIAGVGSVAYGFAGVNWAAFGGKILLPLLLSPLVALALTSGVLRLWRTFAPNPAADCLCFDVEQRVPALAGGPMDAALGGASHLHLASCVANGNTRYGVTLNHLHWLTSGATSFSRGLNDAPKMAALMLAAAALSGTALDLSFASFLAITAGMLAGSWLAGQRVTGVLATRVTSMDHHEGFVANLVTAALVGPGAALGLPMSTTHVSSGAILGVAAGRGGDANRKTIRDMLAAWVVTLPAAALLGLAAFLTLQLLGLR